MHQPGFSQTIIPRPECDPPRAIHIASDQANIAPLDISLHKQNPRFRNLGA
jgi:hypothetical protein